MQETHKARMVHSDLKPANFLMVEGVLKLIDFGIAKSCGSNTTSIDRECATGTANYMSPEAVSGSGLLPATLALYMRATKLSHVLKCKSTVYSQLLYSVAVLLLHCCYSVLAVYMNMRIEISPHVQECKCSHDVWRTMVFLRAGLGRQRPLSAAFSRPAGHLGSESTPLLPEETLRFVDMIVSTIERCWLQLCTNALSQALFKLRTYALICA